MPGFVWSAKARASSPAAAASCAGEHSDASLPATAAVAGYQDGIPCLPGMIREPWIPGLVDTPPAVRNVPVPHGATDRLLHRARRGANRVRDVLSDRPAPRARRGAGRT